MAKKEIILILLMALIFIIALLFHPIIMKIFKVQQYKNNIGMQEENAVEQIKVETKSNKEDLQFNDNKGILQSKKVENASYLEILGLEIQSKKEYSYVTVKVKNNSKNIKKKLSLTISIFNKEGENIAEFTNTIKDLNSQEIISSFGITNKDISAAYDYTVELKK